MHDGENGNVRPRRCAIGGMPICGASTAARSLPGSIIGHIESYLELHETHATVGLPTVQPLRRDEVPYEQALHALVSSRTVEQEEAARIELMWVSRARSTASAFIFKEQSARWVFVTS